MRKNFFSLHWRKGGDLSRNRDEEYVSHPQPVALPSLLQNEFMLLSFFSSLSFSLSLFVSLPMSLPLDGCFSLSLVHYLAVILGLVWFLLSTTVKCCCLRCFGDSLCSMLFLLFLVQVPPFAHLILPWGLHQIILVTFNQFFTHWWYLSDSAACLIFPVTWAQPELRISDSGVQLLMYNFILMSVFPADLNSPLLARQRVN